MEIGAIKIKDGFFIGDVYAAKDVEFIILNKITRIVNCSAGEVPNVFASEGILYFPFGWVDVPEQDYLRDRQALDQAVEFLNQSIELGESVLIHSVRCQNRALFMCACYLIRQFRWTADTSLNFIYSRKLIPRMRADLQKQLRQYEQWQRKPNEQFRAIVWSPEHVKRCIGGYTHEEVVLANTFLNTYIEPNYRPDSKKITGTRLQWNDRQVNGARSNNFKNKLCTSFVPAFEHLQFCKQTQPEEEEVIYKPILKKPGIATAILKQNLIEQNCSPQNVLAVRASSANNANRASKQLTETSKKQKFNRSGSDKDFENDFPQSYGSLAKRNTLDPNLLTRNKRESLNRSSSKDRKLESLLASSKAKLSAFYSNMNSYNSYKPEKQHRTSKPMKKMASTKMIRPHSGQPAYTGPLGLNQARTFMEGLTRFSQDPLEK